MRKQDNLCYINFQFLSMATQITCRLKYAFDCANSEVNKDAVTQCITPVVQVNKFRPATKKSCYSLTFIPIGASAFNLAIKFAVIEDLMSLLFTCPIGITETFASE